MTERLSLYPYKIRDGAPHPLSDRGIGYGVRCTNRNATSSKYLGVKSSSLPECSIISIEDEARALDLAKFLLKFKGHTVGYYFVDEQDSPRKFLFPLFHDDLDSWCSRMLPGEGVGFIPWFNERFKPEALPIWSKILKSTIQMHENGLQLQKSKTLLKDGLIIIIDGEPYIIECPLELGEDGVSVEVDIKAVLKKFIDMITHESKEDALPTCVKASVQYFKTLISDNTSASALTYREKLWDPLFLSKQDKFNFVRGILDTFSGRLSHLVDKGTESWHDVFQTYNLNERKGVYEELMFFQLRILFEKSKRTNTWKEEKENLEASYRGWFDVLDFTRLCIAHYAQAVVLSKIEVPIGEKRKLKEIRPVDGADVVEYLDKDFEIIKHIANFVKVILELDDLGEGSDFNLDTDLGEGSKCSLNTDLGEGSKCSLNTEWEKKRLQEFMTLKAGYKD